MTKHAYHSTMKRSLAIFIALAMVLALLPVFTIGASAAGPASVSGWVDNGTIENMPRLNLTSATEGIGIIVWDVDDTGKSGSGEQTKHYDVYVGYNTNQQFQLTLDMPGVTNFAVSTNVVSSDSSGRQMGASANKNGGFFVSLADKTVTLSGANETDDNNAAQIKVSWTDTIAREAYVRFQSTSFYTVDVKTPGGTAYSSGVASTSAELIPTQAREFTGDKAIVENTSMDGYASTRVINKAKYSRVVIAPDAGYYVSSVTINGEDAMSGEGEVEDDLTRVEDFYYAIFGPDTLYRFIEVEFAPLTNHIAAMASGVSATAAFDTPAGPAPGVTYTLTGGHAVGAPIISGNGDFISDFVTTMQIPGTETIIPGNYPLFSSDARVQIVDAKTHGGAFTGMAINFQDIADALGVVVSGDFWVTQANALLSMYDIVQGNEVGAGDFITGTSPNFVKEKKYGTALLQDDFYFLVPAGTDADAVVFTVYSDNVGTRETALFTVTIATSSLEITDGAVTALTPSVSEAGVITCAGTEANLRYAVLASNYASTLPLPLVNWTSGLFTVDTNPLDVAFSSTKPTLTTDDNDKYLAVVEVGTGPNTGKILKAGISSAINIAALSTNTDIAVSNANVVTNIVNTEGSRSLTVINGKTVADLTGALNNTTNQTYAVETSAEAAKTEGYILNGDRLIVTAQDGTANAIYTITVPAAVDKTSAPFSTTTANDTVTITLTGGTFKTGTIAATDFTFAGTNAAALAAGTFTRTSDTVVTITNLVLAAADNNTVLVKGAAQVVQASSVTGAASTGTNTRTVTGAATIAVNVSGNGTYSVTTANIPNGTTGTIKWYAALTGGTASDDNKPANVTIGNLSAVNNNAASFTIAAAANATAGSYYFTVTFAGVESERKTLIINALGEDVNITGITVGGAPGAVLYTPLENGTPYYSLYYVAGELTAGKITLTATLDGADADLYDVVWSNTGAGHQNASYPIVAGTAENSGVITVAAAAYASSVDYDTEKQGQIKASLVAKSRSATLDAKAITVYLVPVARYNVTLSGTGKGTVVVKDNNAAGQIDFTYDNSATPKQNRTTCIAMIGDNHQNTITATPDAATSKTLDASAFKVTPKGGDAIDTPTSDYPAESKIYTVTAKFDAKTPVNTVSLSGTATVGQTLTAAWNTSVDGTDVTVKWYRAESATSAHSESTVISTNTVSASTGTHNYNPLVQDDAGKYVYAGVEGEVGGEVFSARRLVSAQQVAVTITVNAELSDLITGTPAPTPIVRYSLESAEAAKTGTVHTTGTVNVPVGKTIYVYVRITDGGSNSTGNTVEKSANLAVSTYNGGTATLTIDGNGYTDIIAMPTDIASSTQQVGDLVITNRMSNSALEDGTTSKTLNVWGDIGANMVQVRLTNTTITSISYVVAASTGSPWGNPRRVAVTNGIITIPEALTGGNVVMLYGGKTSTGAAVDGFVKFKVTQVAKLSVKATGKTAEDTLTLEYTNPEGTVVDNAVLPLENAYVKIGTTITLTPDPDGSRQAYVLVNNEKVTYSTTHTIANVEVRLYDINVFFTEAPVTTNEDAKDALTTGGDIVVSGNVTLEEGVTVASNTNIVVFDSESVAVADKILDVGGNDVTVSGGGALTVTTGEVKVDSGTGIAGKLNLNGANLEVSGAGTVDVGTGELNLSGGGLALSGAGSTATVAPGGTLNASGGSTIAVSDPAAVLTVAGTMKVEDGASLSVSNGTVDSNTLNVTNATTAVSGGTVNVGGASGSATIINSTTNVSGSGTLNLQADTTISGGATNINGGTLKVSAGATNVSGGTTTVTSGKLEVAGGTMALSNNSTLDIATGGTVAVTGGKLTLGADANLSATSGAKLTVGTTPQASPFMRGVLFAAAPFAAANSIFEIDGSRTITNLATVVEDDGELIITAGSSVVMGSTTSVTANGSGKIRLMPGASLELEDTGDATAILGSVVDGITGAPLTITSTKKYVARMTITVTIGGETGTGQKTRQITVVNGEPTDYIVYQVTTGTGSDATHFYAAQKFMADGELDIAYKTASAVTVWLFDSMPDLGGTDPIGSGKLISVVASGSGSNSGTNAD